MDCGVGSIFSAINAAFTFAEFIAKLNDVPEEARRFSTLIHRVRLDYYEALRLLSRSAVKSRFANDQYEREYVHGTIRSVRSALADIGRFVEKIRVQNESGKGTVTLGKRMEWLWRYRSKVDSSERVLDTSHKSMLAAMHRMEIWIDSYSNSRTPSVPGLPAYQEVVIDEKGGLGDDFIVTKISSMDSNRSKKPSGLVSVDELAIATEDTERFDPIPAMSPRVYGPVDTAYLSPYESTTSLASSYVPRRSHSEYRLPCRPQTVPSSPTNAVPFPEFNDISRSVSARSSFLSLRSEYAQSSTLLAEPRSSPSTPQARRSTGPNRASSERSPYRTIEIDNERPRSAMSVGRDLRRASMRLASGGYDATRIL